MDNNNDTIIADLNRIVASKTVWLDMSIWKMSGEELSIYGFISYSYPHCIEIIFDFVQMISMPTDFTCVTKNRFIRIVEGTEMDNISMLFDVARGNQLFQFLIEGDSQGIQKIDKIGYISAKSIRFDLAGQWS